MAAPAPAGSLLRGHARCVIVPIDPAIGQLLAAAQSLGQESERLLPVLAAVPDAWPRRMRHRLAVILGSAVCAVLAGAWPFEDRGLGRRLGRGHQGCARGHRHSAV